MANTGYQGGCRLSCEPNQPFFLTLPLSGVLLVMRTCTMEYWSPKWGLRCDKPDRVVPGPLELGWGMNVQGVGTLRWESPGLLQAELMGALVGVWKTRMPRDTLRVYGRQDNEFSAGERALAGNCVWHRSFNDAFCPCPENLSEAGLKSKGLMTWQRSGHSMVTTHCSYPDLQWPREKSIFSKHVMW